MVEDGRVRSLAKIDGGGSGDGPRCSCVTT